MYPCVAPGKFLNLPFKDPRCQLLTQIYEITEGN
jgi:hypothetical protein